MILFIYFLSDLELKANRTQLPPQLPIKLGAYYFDGWTGETNHITASLKADFPSRKPKWGWVTSTPDIMRAQIREAENAGISFFSFCWYYNQSDSESFRKLPLNRALSLFIATPNHKMEFNLLVANHQGYLIGPKDWDVVTDAWISYFKRPEYLRIGGKPLLTFFDFRTLIKEFGSISRVREALENLRQKARNNGIPGVNIAACIGGAIADASLAEACGFNILTAYNNHSVGFTSSKETYPIDSLIKGSVKVWNMFKTQKLPYIPAITLNWDPRPWGVIDKRNSLSPRYSGYSPNSVYSQIIAAKKWINNNSLVTTKEKLVIVYAWNEYGEGAWLTPSSADKGKYLNQVKRALAARNK